MDPHSRAPKKNTSHGNEVLPQDTTNLIQRPCYQQEVRAKIQQAIGPHDDLTIIETQTEVVWTCLPFIRSGQNHFARHSEKGEEYKADTRKGGKTNKGMDGLGVCQVPEGSGEQKNGGNWW